MNPLIFNEEYVKNLIILPLLTLVGAQCEELAFETTFQIQLGRGIHTVNGAEASAAGRLDILCRSNGRPLFVIELKAESIPLTEADRRQGLSYARLLEPMAPYVLLTNGKTIFIYDTYSGQRIDQLPSIPLSGMRPSLETEISLRFEALKHFIGISKDNLLTFCKVHNRLNLDSFRSKDTQTPELQLQRKYIPSTYVNRPDLENRLKDFINQNAFTAFSVIGTSGVGKTNTMCHFVESHPEEPFLFYSGTLLSSSLLNQICADFNLYFSAQEAPISLLKKLSSLGEIHGTRLTVFLDAIDEWESPDKEAELDQIVSAFNQLGMRLVLSCKIANWGDFLVRKGVSNTLSKSLFPNTPILSDYSPVEFSAALTRYSKLLALRTSGTTTSDAFLNPFSLRVACEVAHYSQMPLDLSRLSRADISKFLDLKLAKSSSASTCLRVLDGIASLMASEDLIQLEETTLREHLGIEVLSELPRDLFDHGVLYRYVNESGRAFVGFYFSTVRDYLVACRLHRLQELQGQTRISTLKPLLRTYIGESSVIYFFRTGSNEERMACLEAAIEEDESSISSHATNLLAWHGDLIVKSIPKSIRKKLFGHLRNVLFAEVNNSAAAEKTIDAITHFGMDPFVEAELVDWLCRLGDFNKPIVMISSRIADLLQKADSPNQTAKLVKLCLEHKKDAYVRRYAIEAISQRSVPRKKVLFLKLIRDKAPDVRTWVKSWYGPLEDRALRRAMFNALKEELSPYIREDIVGALSNSRLKGTDRWLFKWLRQRRHRTRDKGEKHLTAWICRALADLNYQLAVPEFIRRLRRDPQSEIGEHILIALGDMRAKQALPVLFDLLKRRKLSLLWCIWCARAISRLMTAKDLSKLQDINLREERTAFTCVLALAMFGGQSSEKSVLSYLLNTRIAQTYRSHVLSEWAFIVMGFEEIDGSRERTSAPQVSEDFQRALRRLVKEHNAISPLALMIMMSLERDLSIVAHAIQRDLPCFRSPVLGREVVHTEIDQLRELGCLIRPWLNRQLASHKASSTLLISCAALAELMGDLSTWEAITSNRTRIESAIKAFWLATLERRLRGEAPPRGWVEGMYRP